jgi:hypothetical protein
LKEAGGQQQKKNAEENNAKLENPLFVFELHLQNSHKKGCRIALSTVSICNTPKRVYIVPILHPPSKQVCSSSGKEASRTAPSQQTSDEGLQSFLNDVSADPAIKKL